MRIEAVFESAGCHRAYLSLSHATGTGRLKGGFFVAKLGVMRNALVTRYVSVTRQRYAALRNAGGVNE